MLKKKKMHYSCLLGHRSWESWDKAINVNNMPWGPSVTIISVIGYSPSIIRNALCGFLCRCILN